MPVYPETNNGSIIEAGRTQEEKPSSGKALLDALREIGVVGMWEDREDIGETVEYARKLREGADYH